MSETLDVEKLMRGVYDRLMQREAMPRAAAATPEDNRFYELKRAEAYHHHQYGAFGREIQQKRQGLAGKVEFFAKRVTRKLLGWYVRPQIEFNASLTRAIAETVKHFETMAREIDALRAENASLRARVDVLLDPAEGLDYFRFESRFRGPVEMIREMQRPYVSCFAGPRPVLDIGCGRGEFLELLREAGLSAYGVDQDAGMIAECRARGLMVEHGDALAHLATLPDGALGGVYLSQVVEHMPPAAISRLLKAASAKLAPGGTLVAETPNTICEPAMRNFYLDPTHVRPVHPELLRFLGEEAGLAFSHFHFTSAMPGYEPTRREIGEGLEREDVSQYRDYAAIFRKL